MLEHAVIHHSQAKGRNRLLLASSAGLHGAALMGAIAFALIRVTFPQTAPRENVTFKPAPLVAIPPESARPAPVRQEPATRRAAGAQEPAPPQPTAQPAETQPQTAPTTIGDTSAPFQAINGTSGNSSTAQAPGPADSTGTGGDHDAPAGPIPVTGDVHAPIVIQRVEPVYPRPAIAIHLSGSVRISCVIDLTGHVVNPQIAQSTNPMFNNAALDAVQRWRFVPGSLHGKPVETLFELTVVFRLQ